MFSVFWQIELQKKRATGFIKITMVTFRPITPKDYAAVNAIGTAEYPRNYYECDNSFESKISGYPHGCSVADLDGIVGYVISFPYVLGRPFPLGEIYSPVDNPDCYYIHDLCVLKEFRGKGIAKQLAKVALNNTWAAVALVSVVSNIKFWEKLGFRGFAEIKYGGQKAEYMLCIRDKLL